MPLQIIGGLLIPLAGTTLGAACVFCMRGELDRKVERALLGFAAGVMTAASVWSLLVPALEESAALGHFAFAPAAIGFWAGTLFLLALDHFVPHLHLQAENAEGPQSRLGRYALLLLAVTLHNIPEGMAIGVVFAGVINGSSTIAMPAALALAVGIAIQNFPEGAIISLPLRAEGTSRAHAFLGGFGSGVVEPIAALVVIAFAPLVAPALPYMLSFAAGAMIYVVVEELIPEMSQGAHSNVGPVLFAAGFTVMMALDVALG